MVRWYQGHGHTVRLLVAVMVLVLVVVVIVLLPEWLVDFTPQVSRLTADQFTTAVVDTRQTLVYVLGGLIAAGGLYYTDRRHRLQQDANRTDRYTTAVGQLGSDFIEVRAGGIYALERLANESERDRESIYEVLCAFVRERAIARSDGRSTADIPRVATDVRAACIVLSRRARVNPSFRLDFSGADLSDVDLSESDWSRTNFRDCLLVGTSFRDSKLLCCDLTRANLTGGNLTGAQLTSSRLTEAKFRVCELNGSELSGTTCTRTDFSGALMAGAVMNESQHMGSLLVAVQAANLRVARSRFVECTLGGYLLESQIESCTFNRGTVRNARFSRATLRDTTWAGTTFDDTDFTGAQLAGSRFKGCTFVSSNPQTASEIDPAAITE